MPTYEALLRFWRDWDRLTLEQKRLSLTAVARLVEDLSVDRGFRAGLRVKGVQGAAGIYEMTWAPNGRATFHYGRSVQEGLPHIVWRRIGTHDVFDRP
jgi:hypothetical protein